MILKILPIIALGILPLAIYVGPNEVEPYFQYYTDVGVQAELGPVFVGGSITTAMTKEWEGVTFDPIQASYHVWAGLKKSGFSFSADYMCSHPVAPFQRFFGTKSQIDINRLMVEVRYDPRGN